MKTVFHTWSSARFTDLLSNLRRKNLYRTSQGSNFCGDSFSNRDNARANLEEKVNRSILKDDFRQERTHPFLHQQNQCNQTGQSFSSIEINKSLPASVHSVSQIKFKFRSQFWFLPQIRCLITLRLQSSFSIDSKVTDNIIRKVINVQQEKYRTNNGPLRNSNINWIILLRFLIQNHPKPPITE